MAANSRFAIAVHTLGILAFVGDESVSSEMIAKSVDTNPVVIRRIVGNLVKHGLVRVRMGTGGGSMLTRPPEEITLAEIYQSLEEEGLFQVPLLADDHCCPIGRAVRPVVSGIVSGLEESLLGSLQKLSLKDVMESVKCRVEAESSPD